MDTQEDATLYETLGINPAKQDVLSISEKDLTTAYRRAALRWHPDKNRNNPIAATHFSRVVDAYETLSVPTRRKPYDDNIRKARARKQTLQNLDVTRRRLREQLHEREQLAAAAAGEEHNRQQARRTSRQDALSRVQTEIDRARKQRERHQHNQQQQQQYRAATPAGRAGAATMREHRDSVDPSTQTRDNNQREREKQEQEKRKSQERDSAFWSSVPDFNQFKAKEVPVSFDQFEQAILQGRSPFP